MDKEKSRKRDKIDFFKASNIRYVYNNFLGKEHKIADEDGNKGVWDKKYIAEYNNISVKTLNNIINNKIYTKPIVRKPKLDDGLKQYIFNQYLTNNKSDNFDIEQFTEFINIQLNCSIVTQNLGQYLTVRQVKNIIKSQAEKVITSPIFDIVNEGDIQ